MTTAIKQRPKVTREELSVLSAHLGFLKDMVEIKRQVRGEESCNAISRNMEKAIIGCDDIAERLLYNGLEEER